MTNGSKAGKLVSCGTGFRPSDLKFAAHDAMRRATPQEKYLLNLQGNTKALLPLLPIYLREAWPSRHPGVTGAAYDANDLAGSVALRSWRMPSDANQAPGGQLLPGSSAHDGMYQRR
jgi:hypothetical protein